MTCLASCGAWPGEASPIALIVDSLALSATLPHVRFGQASTSICLTLYSVHCAKCHCLPYTLCGTWWGTTTCLTLNRAGLGTSICAVLAWSRHCCLPCLALNSAWLSQAPPSALSHLMRSLAGLGWAPLSALSHMRCCCLHCHCHAGCHCLLHLVQGSARCHWLPPLPCAGLRCHSLFHLGCDFSGHHCLPHLNQAEPGATTSPVWPLPAHLFSG